MADPRDYDWRQDLYQHADRGQVAERPSTMRALALGIGSGLTFSFLDELRGLAATASPPSAAPNPSTPETRRAGSTLAPPTPRELKAAYPGVPYTDAYQRWFREARPDVVAARTAEQNRRAQRDQYVANREDARLEERQAAEAHPTAYTAGQIGGGLAVPMSGTTVAGLGVMGPLGRLAAPIAERVAAGTLAAGVAGGAFGAGQAPELSDVPQYTLEGATNAAKFATAFGLGAPAIQKGSQAATSALGRALSTRAQSREAARIAALPYEERLRLAEEDIAARSRVPSYEELGQRMYAAQQSAQQRRILALPESARKNLAEYEIRARRAGWDQKYIDQEINAGIDHYERQQPPTTGNRAADWLLEKARQQYSRSRTPEPTPVGIVATPKDATKIANAAKQAGGFTYDPARREYVTRGYALSTSPEKEEVLGNIGGPTLSRYMNRNEPTFMRDENAVAGGWRDPATGKWYLDVSKVVPNKEEALAQAKAAHQKAIYDLGAGETIPVGTGLADDVPAAGFTAYHGSPHVYEGPPSLKHVGTGEDTLMEGYGTYATSKPEIGEFYRKTLTHDRPTGVQYKGKPAKGVEQELGDMIRDQMDMSLFGNDLDGPYTVADAMMDLDDHLSQRIAADRQYIEKYAGRPSDPEWGDVIHQQVINDTRKSLDLHEAMAALLKKSKPEDFQFSEPGAIYKWDVSEHAPMLDWNKEIRDQPQVHEALGRLRERIYKESPELLEVKALAEKNPGVWKNYATPTLLGTIDNPQASNISGRRLYENLFEHYNFQANQRDPAGAMRMASEALSDAGLVGHSYTGKSSGATNYVVYNPERDVKPLERYPSLEQARAANPNFARGGRVRRMADGGVITADDMVAQQQAAQQMQAAADAQAAAAREASFSQFMAQRGDRTAASMASHGGVGALPTYAPNVAPAPAQPVQVQPIPVPLVPSHGRTPAPQAPVRMPDPFAGVMGMMSPPAGAVMAIGKAQQQQALNEADLAAKQTAWVQEQMKWYTDARAKIDADYNATVQDYASRQIDPRRVFKNMSTAQKVLTSIGLILGGFGSGAANGRNPVVDMVYREIENDVQAQAAELGKRKNLVDLNYQRYGNLDAAMNATRAQQVAYYESELKRLAATSNAAQAVPNAQIAAFKLREPLIPMMMQLAQYQGLQSMIKSGGHVVGDMPAPWSWEQYMELAMPGPGGRTTFARSGEDRKAATEKLQKWDMYSDAVDQLDRHRSAVAALGFIPTDAQEHFEQYRNALILQLAGAMGVGKGEAMKLVEQIVPGNISQFIHGAGSIDALRQLGSNGMWSIWETHGSLHNPRLPPLGTAERAAGREPSAPRYAPAPYVPAPPTTIRRVR